MDGNFVTGTNYTVVATLWNALIVKRRPMTTIQTMGTFRVHGFDHATHTIMGLDDLGTHPTSRFHCFVRNNYVEHWFVSFALMTTRATLKSICSAEDVLRGDRHGDVHREEEGHGHVERCF